MDAAVESRSHDSRLAEFYQAIYRIRRVEEEVARVYPSDKIQSPVHLSIGQEGIAVGVCSALRADDVVYGTYRSHAMYLAKGGDLKRMIAELYCRETGCSKGKGGSMHLIDTAVGVMGTSAIVGTTIPNSVGHALAFQMRGQKQVVVSFFGDGATEEGAFHESLNYAALKRLPILFVCENNFYAIHTGLNARQPSGSPIAGRAAAYGIRSETITSGDVFTIAARASEYVESIRKGDAGPCFLECHTYRWREHVGPGEDYQAGYRHRAEAEPWMSGDAVRSLGSMLPARTRDSIEAEVEAEVREAFEFAEKSVAPRPTELFTDVY